MKATGIIRRVDDLGRIVIPKEMRRSLGIREGDPMEIYLENDAVAYKKYYPIDSIKRLAVNYAEVLKDMNSHSVLVVSTDYVIAVSGVSKRDYLERRITDEVQEIIETREHYYHNAYNAPISPVEGMDCQASAVYPIIASGDAQGAIILLAGESTYTTEIERKLLENTARMLGKHIEECAL